MRSRVQNAAWVAAIGVALAGCTGGTELDPEPTGPAPPPPAIATTTQPGEVPALLASQDPMEMALAVSQRYFDSAHVVLMAPAADEVAIARAASIAMAAGTPVLLTDGPGAAPEVDSELVRLSTHSVLTVGAVAAGEFDATGLDIVPDPHDPEALAEIFGVDFAAVDPPGLHQDVPGPDPADPEPDQTDTPAPEQDGNDADAEADDDGQDDGADDDHSDDPAVPAVDDYVRALVELRPGEVLDLAPEGATTLEPTGEISPTVPTERLEGQVVIADGAPEQAAAVGIARAAGADVVLTEHISSDPQVIDQLDGADSILGLGTSFGDDAEFAWRALTAATGVELPGGGQEVFGGKRYVALYGHPAASSLGVLGEQNTAETVDLAEEYAQRYTDLTDDQVIPALEIIATVATSSPGPDGTYSNAWDPETFVPLIEAAQAAGQYVVLDFQPGRSHFLDQVRRYEDLLTYPHVGIALDPEWRLQPNQVHLSQIGHVDAAEVNEVVDYLAGFVVEHNLPQKMFIVHQFQAQMIRDRQDLDTSSPQVALVIHADGQGPIATKFDTWDTLHQDAPESVAWGWKNFIDEDDPLMTPEQTFDVEPLPDFVSYQ